MNLAAVPFEALRNSSVQRGEARQLPPRAPERNQALVKGLISLAWG
jgi:hypothetical protein